MLFSARPCCPDSTSFPRTRTSSTAESFLDEVGMTAIVAQRASRGDVRVLYPGGLNAHDRLVPGLIHCVLIDGKLYRADASRRPVGHELLKFHFPGMKQWPVIPATNHDARVPV